MSHLSAHCSRLDKSNCNMSASCEVVIRRYNRQSSANNQQVELMQPGRSFIYNKMSKGPKTDPRGTLLVTLTGSEIEPSQTTYCV